MILKWNGQKRTLNIEKRAINIRRGVHPDPAPSSRLFPGTPLKGIVHIWQCKPDTEAATGVFYEKGVQLKISKNPQKNTCARVFVTCDRDTCVHWQQSTNCLSVYDHFVACSFIKKRL